MTNYLQYGHKMAEYRLHALLEHGEEMVEKHLTELAMEFGSIRSITKINNSNPEFRVYVICFHNKHAAEMAAYTLGGRLLGEDAIAIKVH